MKVEVLLNRADDQTLQALLGTQALKLVLKLDRGLATPKSLRDLIVRLYTLEGLLLSASKRALLFDLLPLPQASILAKILGLPDSDNPYTLLKSLVIGPASKRTRVLFDFFELTLPEGNTQIVPRTRQVVSNSYPLFDYQRQVVRKVQYHLREAPCRVVLHMPTGAGKTRTAMNVIAEHLRLREPTIIVWLAHTEELCEQAASEFEKAWSALGNREVEIYRFWGDHNITLDKLHDGILVAGLAKMYSTVRQKLQFITTLSSLTSLVVMDEAHSAIAETYKLILEALVLLPYPNLPLLGLTATPGRTWADIDIDEQLSVFFARRKVTLVIEGYDNPIDYLIDHGYIARPAFRSLFYEGGPTLSQSDLRRIQQHLDIPDDLLKRFAQDELRNLAIITEIEQLAKRHTRILVFAATVEHASLLAAVLQMRGIEAAAITGTTERALRTNRIAWFKETSTTPRILCNFGVLTTGFDAPQTSAALIARPTTSLVLYSQMVGRAIRGVRAGGNAVAEIVTVVDHDLPGFGSLYEAFTNWEDVWE